MEPTLYRLGWAAAGIAAAFFLYRFMAAGNGMGSLEKWKLPDFWKMGCLFFRLTGFYCPGCGGRRALLYLMKGQIGMSLRCHPFVLYLVVLYLAFMVSQTWERISRGRYKGMSYHDAYIVIGVVILGGNWLVQNLLLKLAGISLP